MYMYYCWAFVIVNKEEERVTYQTVKIMYSDDAQTRVNGQKGLWVKQIVVMNQIKFDSHPSQPEIRDCTTFG